VCGYQGPGGVAARTGGCGNLDLGVWQPGPGGVAAWVWREERSVAQKLKLVVTLMREAEEGFS